MSSHMVSVCASLRECHTASRICTPKRTFSCMSSHVGNKTGFEGETPSTSFNCAYKWLFSRMCPQVVLKDIPSTERLITPRKRALHPFISMLTTLISGIFFLRISSLDLGRLVVIITKMLLLRQEKVSHTSISSKFSK